MYTSRYAMTEIIEQFRSDPNIQNIQKRHYTSIHVAVLVLRGKIIAHAHNKIGSRSRGCGYSNYSIHAEKNVVKEIGDNNKLNKIFRSLFESSSQSKFINEMTFEIVACIIKVKD